MKWYFVKRHTKVEIPYASIHEDDWRQGLYMLQYKDKDSFTIEEYFTSYTTFVEWRIAAERRAAWPTV